MLAVRYDNKTGDTIVETMPFVDDHGDVRFEVGQAGQAFVKHNGVRTFSAADTKEIESSLDYNTSVKSLEIITE